MKAITYTPNLHTDSHMLRRNIQKTKANEKSQLKCFIGYNLVCSDKSPYHTRTLANNVVQICNFTQTYIHIHIHINIFCISSMSSSLLWLLLLLLLLLSPSSSSSSSSLETLTHKAFNSQLI